MNISISTGALGLPRTSPFCGMPLKRAFASTAPCSAPAHVGSPIFGRSPAGVFELPPPLPRTTARTIAMMTTSATPPAIPRVRGDAWRARDPPAPFERTGGGVRPAVAAAAWRCCLALLPLGMRRKGSRSLGFPGGRKDQESNEKEEAGQRKRRDRHVAELVDPLDGAAARRGHLARVGLLDHSVLDQQVVDRDAGAHDGQREEVARRAVVARQGHEEGEDRERVHADPLEPAELARREVRDLREEEAAAGRDRRDHERRPQLVAPEKAADAVQRPADADQREQADQEHDPDQHLPDHPEHGEDDDRVVRHRAGGYPAPKTGCTLTAPGWRNWSDAPDLKSGGPRAVRVRVPPPASLNQAKPVISPPLAHGEAPQEDYGAARAQVRLGTH